MTDPTSLDQRQPNVEFLEPAELNLAALLRALADDIETGKGVPSFTKITAAYRNVAVDGGRPPIHYQIDVWSMGEHVDFGHWTSVGWEPSPTRPFTGACHPTMASRGLA